MNQEKINRIMKVLIKISEFSILLGAIFQTQHYPYGKTIILLGLFSYYILSRIEIIRLRNIIAKADIFNNKDVSTTN